jgi:hypothetical protein
LVDEKEVSQSGSGTINNLAERLLQMAKKNFEERYSDFEDMVIDYTPATLQLLSELNVTEPFWGVRGWPNSTAVYFEEGAVLGEVIIRNLGGKWIYPSHARLSMYQFLANIGFPYSWRGSIIFPHFQINLKGQRIPVMKIARLRMKLNEKVFSLEKAYEAIKKSGIWPGEVEISEQELRILKEKRMLRRTYRRDRFHDPMTSGMRSIGQYIRCAIVVRDAMRGSYAKCWEYSPKGLSCIDESFSKKKFEGGILSFENGYGRQATEKEKKNFHDLLAYGAGGYLGEIIVRQLGGEWKYPDWRDYHEAVKRHDQGYLTDMVYVELHCKKIPVREIGRLRLENKISSLVKVYDEIKATGNWNQKNDVIIEAQAFSTKLR